MVIDIFPSSAKRKYSELIKIVISDFLSRRNINPDVTVGLHFVTPAKIKNLNRKYRQIDQATEVLSFPIWKNREGIPKSGKVNLGDIFICVVELQDDLNDIIRHGLNHLVGKHH